MDIAPSCLCPWHRYSAGARTSGGGAVAKRKAVPFWTTLGKQIIRSAVPIKRGTLGGIRRGGEGF